MVVVGLEGLGRVERLEERLEVGLGLARCVRRKRRLVGRQARAGGHLRHGVVEDRPRGLLRSLHRVGGRVQGSVAS